MPVSQKSLVFYFSENISYTTSWTTHNDSVHINTTLHFTNITCQDELEYLCGFETETGLFRYMNKSVFVASKFDKP